MTGDKLGKENRVSSKIKGAEFPLEALPSWASSEVSPASRSREDVTFDAFANDCAVDDANGSLMAPTDNVVQIPRIALSKFEMVVADHGPLIGYLLGDVFQPKGKDERLKVGMVYVPRNQDVHTAAGYPKHCEEMNKRLREALLSYIRV